MIVTKMKTVHNYIKTTQNLIVIHFQMEWANMQMHQKLFIQFLQKIEWMHQVNKITTHLLKSSESP